METTNDSVHPHSRRQLSTEYVGWEVGEIEHYIQRERGFLGYVVAGGNFTKRTERRLRIINFKTELGLYINKKEQQQSDDINTHRQKQK